MIRGGVIGVATVAVQGGALAAAVVCILRGLGPYVAALCVAFSRGTRVRIAYFPSRLAVCLTTLSFGVALLLALPLRQ